MMKVIYVVPNWTKHDLKYTTVSLHIPKSIPLEAMYIKSLLNSDIDFEIIDGNVEELSDNELRHRIEKCKADVMVFNTTINYILWRCPPVDLVIPKRLMAMCENMDMITIAIGPHSSVDGNELLEQLECDYYINGEPEVALADFLNSHLMDFSIKGLCSKIINNGCSDEIDMKELPTPNFDAVDITRYEIHSWSNNTIQRLNNNDIKGTILEYSRGCIFHCPYCFRKNFRDSFRKKSIRQIEKEIICVKEKGIKFIYFIDEIFNIDNEEWRELLRILKREKMLFGCQARPDTMSYQMIDLMKACGCTYIEYGVESFTEEVLRAINKSVDKQKMLRIIAYSYQIFGKDNVELGMINFYTEDISKILNLNEEGKWNSKVLRPYPNTYIGDKIYELYGVKEKKWDFLVRYIWWLQIENYENYFKIKHDETIKKEIIFGDYEVSKKCSYEMILKYRMMLTKELARNEQ